MQPVRRGPRIASRTTTAHRPHRATRPIAHRPPIAQPTRSRTHPIAHRVRASHIAPDREPTRSHIASAHRTSRPRNPPTARPLAHRARASTRPPVAQPPPWHATLLNTLHTISTVLYIDNLEAFALVRTTTGGFVWFVVLTFPKFNIYTFLFSKFL